jgi:NADH-quinone oxidoreductase subunit C
VPDATGLEAVAAELRAKLGDDAVQGATIFREQATLDVAPGSVHDVLSHLKSTEGGAYNFLCSVHGLDYLPQTPRLGVIYELLNMPRVERIAVRTRVELDDAEVPSVVDIFPTADFQEREIFDMFGVNFAGHPDMRRILMPEDYEGFPQRRDFPLGGEPVMFTHNEPEGPGWYE